MTGISLPDERRGTYRLLGIVLDGTLLSAPRVMSTISDRGRITGQFTREEVDFIVGVLKAGALPVDLGDAPITEVSFGPSEACRQTMIPIGLATLGLLVVVWSLALVRYRVLGLAVAWSNSVGCPTSQHRGCRERGKHGRDGKLVPVPSALAPRLVAPSARVHPGGSTRRRGSR